MTQTFFEILYNIKTTTFQVLRSPYRVIFWMGRRVGFLQGPSGVNALNKEILPSLSSPSLPVNPKQINQVTIIPEESSKILSQTNNVSEIFSSVKMKEKESVKAPNPFLPEATNYCPNFAILQFFLADQVGGGEGNRLNNAVDFFSNYVADYAKAFPDDHYIQSIRESLSRFETIPYNLPLQDGAAVLLEKLKTEKYVAFAGGYYDADSGHAMLCELFLDEQDHVTFKITNTGDGLEYHPACNDFKGENSSSKFKRNYFYRTLVFSGAGLEQIAEKKFLDIVLSFNRPRPSAKELMDHLPDEDPHFTAKDLYTALYNCWPGKNPILAENPGGTQRANSCSTQSLVKWMKGIYKEDIYQHAKMNLWIKIAAFSDYLKNEANPDADFINDAVRKISTQASKLLHEKVLHPSLFDAWQEIKNLAITKAAHARAFENVLLEKKALSFPPEGIDLTQAEEVVSTKEVNQKADDITEQCDYSHRFPGETPDYKSLLTLRDSFIDTIQNEMSYRLNFFRLLPGFEAFNFENDVLPHIGFVYQEPKRYQTISVESLNKYLCDDKKLKIDGEVLIYSLEGSNEQNADSFWMEEKRYIIVDKKIDRIYDRRQFFTDLGTTLQKFFYTTEGGAISLHINDAFFADLLNAWMIVYLEAKKDGLISSEVLLEWITGMDFLITSFSAEYRFDTPQSRERFNAVAKKCRLEKNELLEKLGSDYKTPPNYWAIEDRVWPKSYMGWIPFGADLHVEGKSIQEWSQLPAMAKFAFKIMQTSPSYEYLKQQLATDCKKAIIMFGEDLEEIPYYNDLRLALGSLFLFADRHVSCSYQNSDERVKTNKKRPIDNRKMMDRSFYQPRTSLSTSFYTRSNRPGVGKTEHYYPEHQIPALKNQYIHFQDLNYRVKNLLAVPEKRNWPFFTEQEEREYLTFAQREVQSRLPECLHFFGKKLHKLADPDYQAALEQALWGEEAIVENLFREQNLPLAASSLDLLFNFLTKGYERLLKHHVGRSQTGAAFLFHLHLRLCTLSEHYGLPQTEERFNTLFDTWEKLIEEGKNNQTLGKSLGEAVFASMPVIESSSILRNNKKCLQLLATTLLLECSQQASMPYKYDALTLNYAYRSFKETLSRSEDAESIWKEAARRIFANDKCEWDPEKDILLIGNKTVYLISRAVENEEDSNMRLLPTEVTTNDAYKKIFGKKRLLGGFYKETGIETYTFRFKSHNYKIVYDLNTKKVKIFKEINGDYFLFSGNPLNLAYNHCFVTKHYFWKNEENIFVEDINSGSLEAIGNKQGIYFCKKGRPVKEILATLKKKNNLLNDAFLKIESPEHTVVRLDEESKNICRIELPRLGLTFLAKNEENSSTLVCCEYPGYYLAKLQHTSFLKDFQNYLVLENAQGHRKIILPVRRIIADKYSPYQKKKLICDSAANPLTKNSLVFDLQPGQIHPGISISPSDKSSTLALIYLYLKMKDYDRALKLIEETQITSHRSIDDTGTKIISWIVNDTKGVSEDDDTVDVHPKAVAIRMHLFGWMALLKRSQVKPLPYSVASRFESDFIKYRNIYNSIGKFAVPDAIFDNLNKIYQSLTKNRRIHKKSIEETYRPFGEPSIYNFQWLWEIRTQIFTSRQKLLPIASYAAPGEEFLLNFFNYYKIAKMGLPEEKEQLKRLLITCHNDFAMSTQFVRIMLVGAIQDDSSSTFETLLNLFSSTEITKEDFEKEIYKIYNQTVKALKDESISIGEWSIGKNKPVSILSSKSPKMHFSFAKRAVNNLRMEFPVFSIDPLEETPSLISLKEACVITRGARDISADMQATREILQWSSTQALQAAKEENVLIQTEFTRIEEGALEYLEEIKNAGDKPAQTLNRDPLEIKKVLTHYNQEVSKQEKKLVKLKEQILEKANLTQGNQQLSLEWMREVRTPLDIETLIISMGRKDLSAIQNANPMLDAEAIKALMKQVGQYALLASRKQQLERCYAKLIQYETLLKNDQQEEALEVAAAEYIMQRNAERIYDPSERPELLAFETLINVLLRKEQLDALNSLTTGSSWELIEARTGFGKSKVILPLWLLLNANSHELAIMAVPDNLLDQQEAYLQNVLHHAYRFFGFRLDFSRDSECTAEEIAAIHEDLQWAQKMKRPVFMSDQTAHNLFVLKIKEITSEVSRGGDPEVLTELLVLRRYLKENATLFIDEPQKVLDDSRESNYSLGQPHVFGKERLLFGMQIYATCFETIKGRYRLECWQEKESMHLPLLTEESYRQDVQKELLEKLIEKCDLQPNNEEIRYLNGEMNREEQEDFEQSLRESKDLNHARDLRILHDQVHHYLPQTLSQNAHEHYSSMDVEQNRIAIPLEDARNPKKGHEYCSPDQVINFTMQANLATPFSENFVQEFFEELAEIATEEVNQGAENIFETLSYRKFSLLIQGMDEKLKPKNMIKITPEELSRVHAYIQQSVEARLQFIGLAVLPKLRRYDNKITSTPHVLMHCFKKAVGASGTLSMQNFPMAFEVKEDKKAIAKTLITLQKKYQATGNPPIGEFPVNNSREIIGSIPQIAQQVSLTTPSVIIEIGAVFRDYHSLLHVAKDLLKTLPEFAGIATFDPKGVPIVLRRDGKCFLPKEVAGVSDDKLFWMYAQKDITGTDAILPPCAQGLVFINEHTTLTELVQGFGRMRGIHMGQDIRLCVDPDAASFIKSSLGKHEKDSLSYFDIITYCVRKEGDGKGKANFRSLTLQWDAILENIFWDNALIDETPTRQVVENFELLHSILVQETRDDPVKNPGVGFGFIDIEIAKQFLKERYICKIDNLRHTVEEQNPNLASKYSSESIGMSMKGIQDNMLYPKQVLLNDNAQATQSSEAASDAVNLSEKESKDSAAMLLTLQEQNSNQKSDVEAENTTEATQLWSTWSASISKRIPLPHAQISFHSIADVFSHDKLRTYAELFAEEPLAVTKNGCATFSGDSVAFPGWVTGYVKPLHYLFIEYGRNAIERCSLCDESEAVTLMNENRKGTLWLVDHGIVVSNPPKDTKDLLKDVDFRKLELQAKILNGDLQFDEQQWETLALWIDSEEKKKLLFEFIEQILFSIHPTLSISAEYMRLVKVLNGISI